jgi:two-component system response regulator YesN
MPAYFEKTKQRIMLHFLVPYLIVLLIPLLIGLITYEKTIEVVESEIEHNNIKLLDQSKDILERRLTEVEMIVSQIVGDTKVIHFQNVSDPFEGSNTTKILETKAGLYDSFFPLAV